MPQTHQVRCPSCGTLFGITDEDGRIVIKHRDLLRLIRGSVEGPCRKCGQTVKWLSPTDSEDEGA